MGLKWVGRFGVGLMLVLLLAGAAGQAAEPQTQPAAPQNEAPAPARPFRLYVGEAETLAPLVGAKVEVYFRPAGPPVQKITTDASGYALIDLPAGDFRWVDKVEEDQQIKYSRYSFAYVQPEGDYWWGRYLKVVVARKGFVEVAATWLDKDNENRPVIIPNQWTMKMHRPEPIGGVVVDEHCRPLAGVRVTAQYKKLVCCCSSEPRWNEPATIEPIHKPVFTDERGRWRYESLFHPPNKGFYVLSIHFGHEHYLSELWSKRIYFPKDRRTDEFTREATYVEEDPEMERYRQSNAVNRMIPTYGVRLRLRDRAGQPVQDARIEPVNNELIYKVTAGPNPGEYLVSKLCDKDDQLLIAAANFEDLLVPIKAEYPYPELTLTLGSGETIRGRLVDQYGKPCINKYLKLQIPLDGSNWDVSIPTDSQGIFEWTQARAGYEYNVKYGGYEARPESVKLKARPEPYELRLERDLRVCGRITDALTGKAINNYRLQVGVDHGDGRNQWESICASHSSPSEGTYWFSLRERPWPRTLRVEAEGYEPATLPIVLNQSHETTCNASLKPVKPPPQLHKDQLQLWVNGLGGKPIRTVAFKMETSATMGHFPSLPEDLMLKDYSDLFAWEYSKELGDHLTLPRPAGKFRLVLYGLNHGYAFLSERDRPASGPWRVTLKPFGRISGTVMLEGKPAKDMPLSLYLHQAGEEHSNCTIAETSSGPDGQFSLNHYLVKSAALRLGKLKREHLVRNRYTFEQDGMKDEFRVTRFFPLERCGDLRVDFADEGCTVTGTLDLPAPAGKSAPAWWCGSVWLRSWPEDGQAIPQVGTHGDARKLWHEAWAKVEPAQWLERRVEYVKLVGFDGQFSVGGVRPGRYQLLVEYSRYSSYSEDDFGKTNCDFSGFAQAELTVPARTGTVELGKLPLKQTQ